MPHLLLRRLVLRHRKRRRLQRRGGDAQLLQRRKAARRFVSERGRDLRRPRRQRCRGGAVRRLLRLGALLSQLRLAAAAELSA